MRHSVHEHSPTTAPHMTDVVIKALAPELQGRTNLQFSLCEQQLYGIAARRKQDPNAGNSHVAECRQKRRRCCIYL